MSYRDRAANEPAEDELPEMSPMAPFRCCENLSLLRRGFLKWPTRGTIFNEGIDFYVVVLLYAFAFSVLSPRIAPAQVYLQGLVPFRDVRVTPGTSGEIQAIHGYSG
jgi:hypothetical protein